MHFARKLVKDIMAKILRKLRELRNADVRYISLVDRAATRIPFRVLKKDEDEVMDLTKIFKSEKSDPPVEECGEMTEEEKKKKKAMKEGDEMEQKEEKVEVVEKKEPPVEEKVEKTEPKEVVPAQKSETQILLETLQTTLQSIATKVDTIETEVKTTATKVETVSTEVGELKTKVADVATVQGDQKKVLDEVVKKSENLEVKMNSTVVAAPKSEDTPANRAQVKKEDTDPRSGCFDTAFLRRRS